MSVKPDTQAPDVVLAGTGDADGYRLYIARSSEQWRWQPLAVLAPGGTGDEAWVGSQCLTGDGRTAVAVVAPWHAVNDPAGEDRGGVAFAVDLATHRTRVLASGVSLYYFDPGCGAGHDVALTRYLGTDQHITQMLRVDVLTGTVRQLAMVPAELTSAIPAAGGLLAIRGAQLVRIAGSGAGAAGTSGTAAGGRVQVVAALRGRPYSLRPDAVGGADLLTAGGNGTSTAWRWAAGRLTRIGQGASRDVALTAAGNGVNVLSGIRTAAVPGLLVHARPVPGLAAVSLTGATLLTDPPRKDAALPEIRTAAGALVRAAAPPAAGLAPVTAATPTDSAAASSPPRAAAGRGPRTSTEAAGTTPKCAVPRNQLGIQVPQPSNAQVNWAIGKAVSNALPGRPAGFDNLPGGAYNPEADFPQPALAGGVAGSHVPMLVIAGIMAQESNWSQASWHAKPGMSGDPLVADYYGDGGNNSFIDYPQADCGYGIGQITDIMAVGADNPTIQQRVAVDYAENIAAIVQHLGAIWNKLAAFSPPLSVNDGNPAWLENWYTTIWAYNSGIQPRDASFGLPAGCAQGGPGCTDSAGNWGLGWANNPINPVYPPNRDVFLKASYADAAHPGWWPYQERVFGWIGTPLLRYDASAGTTVPAYTPVTGYLVQPLPQEFCSLSVDHCDPNDTSGNFCQYTASGPLQFHCWWNQPATIAGGCASGCHADNPLGQGGAEPAATDPNPPACNLNTAQVPLSTSAGTTLVVTEEATPDNTANQDVNLAGCPVAGGRNWANAGTFTLRYATDSSGNPLGEVDFHQLGVGFGGHIWFTHTSSPSEAPFSQVTGTWKPSIAAAGTYQVKVFVPDLGAVATPAIYSITTANGSTVTRTINQSDWSNQWVPLGDFALSSNAAISLSNITPNGDDTSDLAYNAVAFIPRPGTLVHHTVDAFTNFSTGQSLDTTPPSSWLLGDFAGDSSMTQKANSLISGILSPPSCSVSNDPTTCTPGDLRATMSAWQQQVTASNGRPVQWLGLSHPTPPNPLPAGYLDDGGNYKVRASVSVDYLVVNGVIDPGSYTVTATNATGITHVPEFITNTFNAIQADYGIAPPDLSYSATNLQFFNGQNTSWDPLLDNKAPGREYMPDLSVQLTAGNSCLLVQDLAGGAIGWKTILTDPNIPGRAQAWRNKVDALASNGQAPQAVANLADMITSDFFSVPGLSFMNPPPWVQTGSIFYFAPAIWVETHFEYCADGSLHPAGPIDPVTSKAQLADNSYMPDLYLAIDGNYVDRYGAPTNGGHVQAGDWADFSVWPGQVSPSPSPWNLCYIGPTITLPDGSTIPFISRRDGNPWGLPMAISGDLSSSVSFC
jgi:hypothetical protein